ncbi:hypothetical protein C8Q74DRAFT_1194668 [Fomes fomentarius]|nr:hypothetical protein C8Q74DRAFT_1194668 [Fomes fomentarius]
MSTNSGSRCRKTRVRLKVFLITSGQYCASNANLTPWLPFVTGGSWKKSPVTTTWDSEQLSIGRTSREDAYLDAAEWQWVLTNLRSDLSELVEKVAVEH